MADIEKVTFQLNKIVRDGVLQSMLELGQEPDYRELKGNEKLVQSVKKIQEEAGELDPTSESLDNELKDLQSSVYALVKLRGYTKIEFDQLVEARDSERGGFEKAYYVGNLVLRADDPWVAYYRKDPERFPEINQ